MLLCGGPDVAFSDKVSVLKKMCNTSITQVSNGHSIYVVLRSNCLSYYIARYFHNVL